MAEKIDRKVDEVLTFEYRLRGSVYAAAIALDLFGVFTVGVIALELLARALGDSYTLWHLTDLRAIVRKIIKVLALIVCLAGSYLLLIPGTFLTIDDSEKWKILLLAVGVWSAFARIRISEGPSRYQSQAGWLLGIASASCWMIILFV